jgi:hypothetical protein
MFGKICLRSYMTLCGAQVLAPLCGGASTPKCLAGTMEHVMFLSRQARGNLRTYCFFPARRGNYPPYTLYEPPSAGTTGHVLSLICQAREGWKTYVG